MVIPDKTIFIQGVNFLVTIFVLNVLLIKPIREIISKRKGLMDDQMEKIDAFNAGASKKLEDYESQLAAARKEANEIRSSMKLDATATEHSLMSEAGTEAAGTIQAARAEIKIQVQGAMEQLTKDVNKFAEQATGKILGQA
ncbi:ATP synthase F0 subunit B [Pseudodesulfovibrio pelocollis]|uniref:ATP synthase F0 subunit B n=1 Tax=Pseudodesulfovibrio pelocollis TaxID=3051432 RepID=UPI00255AA5CF|nr:ATP synthase F0 subunit B [Pseudodesulfovibrio sp. SB368]